MNIGNYLLMPITGDESKPWIAAVVLILSVIVLVAMFLFGRKGEKDTEEEATVKDSEDEES